MFRCSPKNAKHCDFEQLEARRLLAGGPTPAEQLMIELVNRARANPDAEAALVARELGIQMELNTDVEPDDTISSDPKQPLAPHEALNVAASLHSEDMLARNFFAHDTPDGKTPSDRARAAGYPTGAGENIAWSGNTLQIQPVDEVYQRHFGLVESVGHRVNMMRENWREIGAGVRYGTFTQGFTNYQSIMVGTLFGNRGGHFFITGVAINDLVVQNNFYEINEGLANIVVTATNRDTGKEFRTHTTDSGGYSLQVPNGTYTVTASGFGLAKQTFEDVYVGGKNIKVDFNARQPQARSIRGTVFVDTNQNGFQNSNETGSEERRVYLDMNDDGERSAIEPYVETDASGQFEFPSLLPGEYKIGIDLPMQWARTTDPEFYEVTLEQRHLRGANFGIRSENLPPLARDDSYTAVAGESQRLTPLSNDFDVDGTLVAGSFRIETAPSSGQVEITNQGVFYHAVANTTGTYAFTYTVADDTGNRSNPGTITLHVTRAFPWQNPREPLDVNDDGFVVPQDVLIVISELNRRQAGTLAEQTRQQSEPYLDVNGDNFLTPVDALAVIQHLNRNNVAGGEPPPVENDADTASGEPPITLTDAAWAASLLFDREQDQQAQF